MEKKFYDILNNHKTSNQNETVVKRLDIILKEGGYKKAQLKLNNVVYLQTNETIMY